MLVGMIRADLKPTGGVFGKRLREARLRAGLTQDALGVAIGLDIGPACIRISRYESGVHTPSLDVVLELARALNVPAAFFVTEDDGLARRLLRIHGLNEIQLQQLDAILDSPDFTAPDPDGPETGGMSE